MTKPTITYGHGQLYDFDTSNTVLQSTWTEYEYGSVGTYTAYLGDYVRLNVPSTPTGNKIYYIANNANLTLLTDIYTTIVWRYKTAGGLVQAKIELEFSDTTKQIVLAETSSGGYHIAGSATITAHKTLDHIRLHANQATGSVYYDFALICRGQFEISQFDKIHYSMRNRYSDTEIPSRVGRRKSWMGADETIVLIDGPIDDKRDEWKRPVGIDPDTGKPYVKTDYIGAQVFNDIHHGAWYEPWQWFTSDRGDFKAVMETFDCDEDGALPFKFAYHVVLAEKRVKGGQNEPYRERLGLS